jgi:flavin-dependent dehydrogenase
MEICEHYDCVVMGGGPAGTTTAALVAEAGFSVLLAEREPMPRPHVGESLMPETYWTFERLGVLDQLKGRGFARKVGVQFVSHTGRESVPFFFRQHDPRECSETWHVDRGEFDKMLFDNAAAKGADCRDRLRVLDVDFDGEQAVGIQVAATSDARSSKARSAPRRVGARVVVDATGQQGLLGNRLGVRQHNPVLRKAAIWGHFRGAHRDEEGGGVKTIIMHTSDRQAWFWYIPQANDLVSVGVVADNDYLLKGRRRPTEVFAEELAKCEGAARRLAHAQPLNDLEVAKEFSYSSHRCAGPGWVLVGDAWGFIDPVYSSGVYFALKSGELAADAIVAGLRSNDLTGATLGRWTDHFAEQTRLIRQLVHAFYSGEFRVGKFLQEYPQHERELVDLLIGRIFEGHRGALFEDLQPWLERQGATLPAV